MTGACIFHDVVSKLRYWEKLSPIILLIVNKSPEVGFYRTVFPLSLAVSLRKKGDREPLLDF